VTGVEAYMCIKKTLTETQIYKGAQNTVVSWCKYTKLPKIAWENDTNVKLKALTGANTTYSKVKQSQP